MTNERFADPPAQAEAETVKLVEEVAHVDVRAVETGRVRISTRTETVDDVARAELHGEDVEVIRVPVNRPVTGTPPAMRQEGDVTVVPVFEEVLIVEKRLVLKEELHIRKRATVEAVEVPVTLRRQRATVERSDGNRQT
jgi:uncharacterized protein (TIGR02271 family)